MNIKHGSLNWSSNVIMIVMCTGVLEGKTERGAEKLPPTDLPAFDGGGETERLQQRELKKGGGIRPSQRCGDG